MSLALAAKHLAAHGRNGDSILVHMAPEELKGLNAIAMSNGGSLTVNPYTGLVEAFSLRKTLKKAWKTTRRVAEKGAPIILGAGLTALSGGALSPLAAGMLVGGGQTLRTGSIEKGLMAGLGAYGGAGLYGALAPSAATAAPTAGTTAAQTAGTEATKAAGTGAAKTAGTTAARSAVPAGGPLPGVGGPMAPTPGLGGGPIPPATPLPAASLTPAQVSQNAITSVMTPTPPPPSFLDKAVAAGQSAGQFVSQNKYPLMAAGASLAYGAGAFEQPQVQAPAPEDSYLRPYTFSSGYTGGTRPEMAPQEGEYTGERVWFQPQFTALPSQKLAGGGLVALAEGGAPIKRAQDPYFRGSTVRPSTPPPSRAPDMSRQAQDAYEYLMGIKSPSDGMYTAERQWFEPRFTQISLTPPAATPPAATPPEAATPPRFTMRPTGVRGAEIPTPEQSTTPVNPRPGRPVGNEMPATMPTNPRPGRPNTRKKQYAEGGATHLEKGGFVVPADVVSALGNGSSSAGLELLAKQLGARPIDGPGDGMSDSIRTTIEGKQRAAIARDEAYVPRAQVVKAGGSKKLYEMMDRVRHQAHGKPKQQRKLTNPARLVP